MTDDCVGAVVAAVRPTRPNGDGRAWDALLELDAQINEWVAGDSGDQPASAIEEMLARSGCVVPYRTLQRFATGRCGYHR